MSSGHSLQLGDLVADAAPAAAPARAVHRGAFVELRPVAPDADAAALFDGSHGGHREELWTYMPYGPFAGPGEMAAWLGEIAGGEDPLFFTVCALPSRQPLGLVSFLAIQPAHRCVEVGHIWYLPEAQRTEVNTESIYLLLRHAFDDLGYRRVEWKCDLLNTRSCAAAQRLGFQPEGVFRQHRIVRGRNRDTAWFALLDTQWPSMRALIEQWLTSAPARRPSLRALRAAAFPSSPGS